MENTTRHLTKKVTSEFNLNKLVRREVLDHIETYLRSMTVGEANLDILSHLSDISKNMTLKTRMLHIEMGDIPKVGVGVTVEYHGSDPLVQECIDDALDTIMII